MSEIDDLRRRVARLESAWAGFERSTLPGLYVPCNPRLSILDGSALDVGTYDYLVTSYGVPAGVSAVVLIVGAKWAAAGTTRSVQLLAYGSTTEVYGQITGLAADTYQFATSIVPVVQNKVRVKVDVANTTSAYLLVTGYIR